MPSGSGYEITFDEVSSTTIPEFICHRVMRTLGGKRRTVYRDVPGRAGAWVFPEKPGPRKILVNASVLADSFPVTRRDALVRVADWLSKEGMKKMVIGDEPDRFYLATLTDEPDIEEWRHLGKFDLDFTADPYAYSVDISTEVFSLSPGGSAHTFTIPDGVDVYPVIELTPTGGTLGDFTLIVNGFQLVNSGEIAAGATWTVSSLSYITVEGPNTDTELQGIFNPDTVSMPGITGEFPVLLKDEATQSVALSTGGSASSVDVVISWRRRYR